MPRSILAACAALLAAACAPLWARPPVEVAIVDRDAGGWLPQYRHAGDDWVAGVPGHRYAVRLTNTSGARVLVVLSVDGVNAVTGEDADPSQAGYVLAPWQSTEVAGWRKSLEEVAQFRFTALPDSYAARTGRPENVGVVGIAVFRERREPVVYLPPRSPYPPPYRTMGEEGEAKARTESAAPAAGEAMADAMAPGADTGRQRIGTGHGAREWSPVSRTGFARAGAPVQVTQLRYDAPERLVELGILPRPAWPRRPVARAPQAFPGGFVADPP